MVVYMSVRGDEAMSLAENSHPRSVNQSRVTLTFFPNGGRLLYICFFFIFNYYAQTLAFINFSSAKQFIIFCETGYSFKVITGWSDKSAGRRVDDDDGDGDGDGDGDMNDTHDGDDDYSKNCI